MIFYFGKLAALVFGPLGLTLILLLIALWFYRGRAIGRWTLAFAFLILWSLSTRFISQSLLRGLENQIPGYTVETAPQAPVVIVLGGFMRTANAAHPRGEFNDAADRLMQAFRLYKAGKAPLILVSGGDVPMFGKGIQTESESARSILEEWGVPESAILVETRSKDTEENAFFSRELLAQRGIHRALLVTSASHMPRAFATFRKLGLDVLPSPADYSTGWPAGDLPFQFLPGPDALNDSARALREYVGLLVYRIRGWA
jgi:uncharacterized SAM-binding protein YcdF (DUF218 family)